MYNVIMVPTDGSGFDREAIRVATQMSNRAGAKLMLVRVRNSPLVYLGPDNIDYPREALEQERDWELTQLSALAAECQDESLGTVSTAFEDGPVPDVLARFARLNSVDIIVISSHGRGGFARLSLGSVTDSLIRNTNVPVLVVKPPASYLNPRISRPFQRILVPLDGSKLAEEIIPQVIELAILNEASVILVNVLVPTKHSANNLGDARLDWWEDDIESARAYLGERAEFIRHAGVPATIEITVGEEVADAIARSASRLRADLIAVATRGRGGLSRLLRGSVADKVTRVARTSLLVFHPKSTVGFQEAVDEAARSQLAELAGAGR